MPAYEADQEFLRDWRQLSPAQQQRFKTAVRKLVEDLKAERPPRRGMGRGMNIRLVASQRAASHRP